MKDLDEAIQHFEEEAKDQRWQAEVLENSDYPNTAAECLACAEEQEQLAEWLTQLKRIKEAFKTGEVMNLVAECMSIWGE